MKYVVELVKHATLDNAEEVVWKSEPTTERMAERMDSGMNINLNHETHYTRIVEAN